MCNSLILVYWDHFFLFYFSFLEDISPFFLLPFLWGHWYHCFGLLMTSAPGFKVRMGTLIHPLYRLDLRFTSGVTPADLLMARIAAKPFSSTYLRAVIGQVRNEDLSQCDTRKADNLPTMPARQ